jgi:hypothetical protein
MTMGARFAALVLACGAPALLPASVRAHHSFAAQYDVNQQITIKGTITKVEWTNPHTYFYVDVADERGTVVSWAVEGGAPNVLYREGWKPTTLKQGDQVTILGSRARNGSNLINALSFALPDGRCVFAGTSGPGGTGTPNCTVGRR